ncbi:MAG: glutamate synthase [Oscillospiraceae bacterium]|nr:glutamate synthase [Oscillospiraceae bacterium]
MDRINADKMHFKTLNEYIRRSPDSEITVENVIGHRFIGSGCIGKDIHIHGIPGNALGAYLTQCDITVYGNAQDATGDAMNDGTITIHGNCGDAAGYGMRDGRILIKGSAGYRAGIHMKQFEDKIPLLMIGGEVGDFLAEYQAGGRIIVLGIGAEDHCPVGEFCGTGMHGGVIYIRTEYPPQDLPVQVSVKEADDSDKESIRDYIDLFTKKFGGDPDVLLNSKFYKLTPNTSNPYKQLYVNN